MLSSEQLDHFAGQMSEAEIRFCKDVHDLLGAVIEARLDFETALGLLLEDFKALRTYSFEIDAAAAAGWTPIIENIVQNLPNVPVAQHPSDSQLAFLHDLIGYLDFAARNGLTFKFILMGILHDIAGLSNYDWSLEKAEADFFKPRTSGWAALNAMPVGEPEE
jgi:hypothetical protein